MCTDCYDICSNRLIAHTIPAVQIDYIDFVVWDTRIIVILLFLSNIQYCYQIIDVLQYGYV